MSQLHKYYIGSIMSEIREFRSSHPGFFSEVSPVEAVDLADRITKELLVFSGIIKYFRTGAIRIVLKNGRYSFQYDVKAWRYANRGVPSLFGGMYSGMSLRNYKKMLAGDRFNYNTPDLDSPYDGIGDVFFRRVY